ncbi:class I SAM-dependent methyltransferase [Candidatus Woesearchaeota archaeon]|jgi:2-polyprenyl-3-methyl-5-hydroxy-6-metoxy-1,4-benzoquinol methylase|nr:class I SAM-dependent methyltransferase [Candidatus Woesearchaeota archaeon]MBT6520339.1 class I SAM-dependent methyltransferase [Candidatus Woesearchaeota archaeon]MBT7368292.1 class I SAM-dependent methyltransferase [Candidatus Woesearchaeota archaeon]
MKYGLSYTLITRTTGFLARTIMYYRRTELIHICNLLKNKKNIKILDYGCNTGYFLDMIKNKHPSKNFNLCGADINRFALKYARKKYKDFTFFDINNKFFNSESKKFDVIIISHVLEHIKNRNAFMQNIKKLLKKNGEIIIAIPQERIRGDCTVIQFLYNIVRFRFENPHVVNMKFKDLDKLLVKNGLQIKKFIYTHFCYPFKSKKRRIDSWSLVAMCKNKKS